MKKEELMKHCLAVFLFFVFVGVGCTPYNDESWNNALERFQSATVSNAKADPNSLVQTDISDIQWSLLHNSEDSNNNSGLPQNFIPAGSANTNVSDNSEEVIGLEVVYTNTNNNVNTTFTYSFDNMVSITDTTNMLLASQEDLSASSTSLDAKKILKIETNEETVDEANSTNILIISGTIQRISGTAGISLLNQLKNEDTESISAMTNIGKTEAIFLLKIEYPIEDVTQADYTLSYTTYLMQEPATDEGSWTEIIITNQ